MSAPTATTRATVPLFKPLTKLRRGGYKTGLDNVIATLPPGNYKPLYQCEGQQATEDGDTNDWWVKIETIHGPGWVSAITINLGGDNDPIDGVERRPTAFV
jgi:hypothetical protein